MTKSEIRQLAIELAKAIMEMAEIKNCEWITEDQVLKDFPFGGKEALKRMRLSAELEFRHHWKYLKGHSMGQGRGRSGSVIYHRSRLVDYVNNI